MMMAKYVLIIFSPVLSKFMVLCSTGDLMSTLCYRFWSALSLYLFRWHSLLCFNSKKSCHISINFGLRTVAYWVDKQKTDSRFSLQQSVHTDVSPRASHVDSNHSKAVHITTLSHQLMTSWGWLYLVYINWGQAGTNYKLFYKNSNLIVFCKSQW
jgi:hypothetical protein